MSWILRVVLSAVILAACLASTSLARYCSSPYCSMCNRIFGPMQATPVEFRTPRAIDSTPREIVKLMLALAQPRAHDLLYDCGSGDGRVIELAVRDYRCRAVGLEINAVVAASSRARLRAIDGLPDRWRITNGDATRYDLSQATVAILYLYPETLAKVVPRLTGCTRILSYSHPIPGYPNKTYKTAQGPVYLVTAEQIAAVKTVEVTKHVAPQARQANWLIAAPRVCRT